MSIKSPRREARDEAARLRGEWVTCVHTLWPLRHEPGNERKWLRIAIREARSVKP